MKFTKEHIGKKVRQRTWDKNCFFVPTAISPNGYYIIGTQTTEMYSFDNFYTYFGNDDWELFQETPEPKKTVDELEAKDKRIVDLEEVQQKLNFQIKELQEALRFYADSDLYCRPAYDENSDMENDYGQRARAALGETK